MSGIVGRLEQRTDREKAILVSAGFALAGILWFGLHLSPRLKLVQERTATKEALEAQLVKGAPPPDLDTAKLEARKAELTTQLEKDKAELLRLGGAGSAGEAKVLLAVSDLARRSGVVVRESSPVLAPSGFVDLPTHPRRQLRLVARFDGLRRFLAGLTAPGGSVKVERVDVTTTLLEGGAPRAGSDEGVRVLVVTLVLVL